MRTRLLLSLLSAFLAMLAYAADPTNVSFGEEFSMKSRISDLQWVDMKDKVVYARCSSGNLYRSFNLGISWEDQLSKMADSTLYHDPGNRYGVREIVMAPSDRAQALFLGFGTTQWRTKNKGQTYEALRSGKRFYKAVPHPTEKDWILAAQTSDASCDSETSSSGHSCHIELWVTQDFGSTWKLIARYVQKDGFDWAYIGLPEVPKERIDAVSNKRKEGTQHYGWGIDYDFVYIDKLNGKEINVVSKGQAFAKMDNYTFVAAMETYSLSSISLMVDKNHHGFRRGLIPTDLNESGYSILETALGAVFLHVNHRELKSDWGNLYLSNADGTNYVLSLPYQHRNEYGLCDFERVKGLKGIFMTNVISNVDELGAMPVLQTKMTFDNGGEWHFITPPTKDSAGQPTCKNTPGDSCHLHLHGITSAYAASYFPPFYSVESAAGVIIATGNIGPYLSMHSDSSSVFVSSDAGLSWTEVRKGPHIYEFGDHGAIIVMASTAGPTNKLIHSWNHGKTWAEVEFTKTPFDVENIITEPSATSQKFLLYGMRGSSSVSVHVDFSGLHERQCSGIENPGTSESDYELWTPSDGARGCIMGHKMFITRRKSDVECFNGLDYERVTIAENCECSREDFECEYGFNESEEGKCIPDGANRKPDPESRIVTSNHQPENCPEGEKYYVTSGYRLVAGNTCKGGLNLHPVAHKCQSGGGGSGSSGIWIGLLVTGIVIGSIAFLYKKNDNVRGVVDGVLILILDIPCPRVDTSRCTRFFSRGHHYQSVNLSADDDDDDDADEAQELA